MKLSAPKQITFWIAVIVAVIGVIAGLVSIPVLSGFAFWIVVIAFIILAAANLLEGL
jgi:threonine/homoserine/homoserine lactone efflux protein